MKITPSKLRHFRSAIASAIALTALLALGAGCGHVRSPPPTVELDAEELEFLQSESRRFVVALDPRWYSDSGTGEPQPFSGLEADFLALLEKKLGVTFEVDRPATWEELLEREARGEIDFLPSVRNTPENQERWLLTDPYLTIPVVLMGRKTLESPITEAMLRQMTIGIGRKYGLDEFIATSYSWLNVAPVRSDLDGLLDVALGQIDLMIIDQPTASFYIDQQKLTNLRIAGRVGPSYAFSMAVRKERPLLFRILQKGLALITPEDRLAMSRKRLDIEAPPFYRNRIFWYWFGGGMTVVLSVLYTFFTWNKTLARQIEERRRAEREVLEISGMERRRIGRDLHDSLGQQLAGSACLARLLASRLATTNHSEGEAAGKLADLVEDAIKQSKFIVRGLMPVEFLQEGLSVALQRLANETTSMAAVSCRYTADGPCPVFDNDVATNLYRIAQEAVTNAIKHGKARNILIRLNVSQRHGTLSIDDDGVGFESGSRTRDDAGMGFRTMRYRAEMCGGHLSIAPNPSSGVRVVCTFVDRDSGKEK